MKCCSLSCVVAPLPCASWKSRGNCGPRSMMNDEFVPHNSTGGWDVLNKWVSMLKEKKGRGRGVADPPKRIGVPGLCLKLKAALCFAWSWNVWNVISADQIKIFFSPPNHQNQMIVSIVRAFGIWSCGVSAGWYARTWKMRCSQQTVFNPGMLGSKWRMCSPPPPFFSQIWLCYSAPTSPPAPTCGRFFHFNLFRVHLRLRSTWQPPRLRLSQASSPLSLSCWSDGAVRLSLSTQRRLDFTYSPETRCVHGHVLISSVTSIPNAVFFISRLHSVRVRRRSDLPLRLKQLIFLACVLPACNTGFLSANLHLGVNWSLTAWSSKLCRPVESPPPLLFLQPFLK